MRLLLVLWLIHSVLTLNIVVSSGDSWVTKNVRHLYQQLQQNGHRVLLVAPLYQQQSDVNDNDDILTAGIEVFDGGDFKHLLPANQLYYKNIMKLKMTTKAKGVIDKAQLEEFDSHFNVMKHKNSLQWGNDPLDNNNWYVNTKNPVNKMAVFLDNVIPQHYSDFNVDLVIYGPSENNTNAGNSDMVSRYLLTRNITTIAVKSGDNHHVYYKDSSISPKSVFLKNIHFINDRIIDAINTLEASHSGSGGLLPDHHGLCLTFPSMNYVSSKCSTMSKTTSPKFRLSHFKKLMPIELPSFENNDNRLVKRTVAKLDDWDQTFVDTLSYYFQNKVKHDFEQTTLLEQEEILDNCGISVGVNYLRQLEAGYSFYL